MGPKWLSVVMMMSVLVLELGGLSSHTHAYGCLEQERLALLQLKPLFYYIRYFSDWTEEEGSNCCSWEGVGCNITTGRVTKLSLRNAYTGEEWYMNASLFLPFEELRSLDLSSNGMTGFVKDEGFGKLSKLRHLQMLDLSVNYFDDATLSYLTNISSLKSLKLVANYFETGLNPKQDHFKWLSRLSGLETLDLSKNHLTNSILLHLDGLSSLKTLILKRNKLKGTIHIQEYFFNLTNLKKLVLSQNYIESLGQSFHDNGRQVRLINLEEIDLSRNLFNDSILAYLSGFSNLKSLNIGRNNLKAMHMKEQLNVLSKVENLILDNNPLDINILQSIGSLTSLKTLFMYNCSLTGTLPTQGWCDLKSLEVLSLKRNALMGEIASCLGNLTSLRYLDLSNNQFQGNVTSNTPLAKLAMLKFLSLSNNHFRLPISFKPFSNHSDLKFLLSDGNKLVVEPGVRNTWFPKFQLKIFSLSNCTIEEQGNLQLPDFLYYQYNLRYIDLSYINFGGIRFPHWLLENNTGLEAFYMVNSSILGPFLLPSHPISDMGEVDISNNEMQHQIPKNICSIFPYLEALDMSRNNFKSEIPHCLGRMSSLEQIDMSYNHLFGGIPEELARSMSLTLLRLSNNNLSGKMFPTIYRSLWLETLFLDGNNFRGEMPHFSPFRSTVLGYLDLSDNHLSGKLPRWLWNQTELQILSLSNNHFEGSLPIGLCDLVNLYFLDLSGNLLSGSIPSCFHNLQNMQHVHLSKNKLSGRSLHAFSESSSLVTLNLSENNFTGKITDQIDKLQALSVLLLNTNHFHGEFPLGLCKLFSLSIVNLSRNKLSGSIPSCLSNLTLKTRSEKADIILNFGGHAYFNVRHVLANSGLTIYDLINDNGNADGLFVSRDYPPSFAEEIIEFSTKGALHSYKGYILAILSGIDLSCNQLTGIIPPGLGNLGEIRALNLSHNNLTGSIPSTFSKLKQIESLDLSYNNLNGTIPPQLTELHFLAVFSVAHNNLSGRLPDMKAQFGTFDESSYEGNPFLCGPPLENNCGGGGTLPETPNSSFGEEEDAFMDMGVFYISFSVSYGIIWLAIVIVLYKNPYWRRAWFYFVEECSTACYLFIVDNLHRLLCLKRNM